MRKSDTIIMLVLSFFVVISVGIAAVLQGIDPETKLFGVEPWIAVGMVYCIPYFLGYVFSWMLLRGTTCFGSINFDSNLDAAFFLTFGVLGVVVIMFLASQGVLPH